MQRKSFLTSVAAVGVTLCSPRAASAQDELRIAFIPEVATTGASISEKQPFIDYMARAIGRPVKLIVPTNYAATVEAIGNGSIDLAHFGAVTFLKAEARYGVRPIAQRVEDRAFHSLFITSSPDVRTLKDLKGKTFVFGDINSTSGHLIPAKEMLEAGIDPDKDVIARFSGNHTTTALAINAGQAVAGALDETVYHKLVDDKKIDEGKARVFFTSKPFVDYVWAARKDIDSASIAKIRAAFLNLNDPTVLTLLRGTKYVSVDAAEYAPVRKIAEQLKLL